MRRIDPGLEAELLRAVKELHRAMARLTGFLAGSLGCLAALEAWAWGHGSSPLLQALACAVAVLGLVAAGLWLSARRGVSRWTWAVDARLGKGSGRALLELGSFQEGAFALEKGRQALTLGEQPKKG
jgi:hypothetical protein